MNTNNNLLQMDMLDILFANRNKNYGAYQLRRTYNKRLLTAIVVMISVCSLFAVAYGVGKKVHNSAPVLVMTDYVLENAPKPQQPVQPPPVRQIQIEQPVATIKVTTPKIVPDEQVITPPPTQDDIANARIDVKTNAGRPEEYLAPPVENITGAVQSLVKKEDYEKEFVTVQQQAQFPGGPEAWRRFLQQNLRSDQPSENGAAAGSYTVVVSFLVDKEGNISEVKAENNPGFGTAEEAVRVIQRGPRWMPALQNGRNVIYRQKQAITFIVEQPQ